MQESGQLSVMGILLVMVAKVLGTVNVVLGTVNASRTSQPQVQDFPGEADYTKPLVQEAMPVLGTLRESGITSGEPQPWCSRTKPRVLFWVLFGFPRSYF